MVLREDVIVFVTVTFWTHQKAPDYLLGESRATPEARAATYGFVAEQPKQIFGDRPESKRTPFCVRLLSPDLIASEDTKSWEVEYSLREIRTATIRQAVETDLDALRKSIATGRWDDLA
ncbi:unnamed protein product [Durusdinium trenchii]|uniref:Uncharacterized protein n=1 Tax=Durusdinium trenchii TaxID=1381693 RepID=A0ABP0QP80_9DINO